MCAPAVGKRIVTEFSKRPPNRDCLGRIVRTSLKFTNANRDAWITICLIVREYTECVKVKSKIKTVQYYNGLDGLG